MNSTCFIIAVWSKVCRDYWQFTGRRLDYSLNVNTGKKNPSVPEASPLSELTRYLIMEFIVKIMRFWNPEVHIYFSEIHSHAKKKKKLYGKKGLICIVTIDINSRNAKCMLWIHKLALPITEINKLTLIPWYKWLISWYLHSTPRNMLGKKNKKQGNATVLYKMYFYLSPSQVTQASVGHNQLLFHWCQTIECICRIGFNWL